MKTNYKKNIQRLKTELNLLHNKLGKIIKVLLLSISKWNLITMTKVKLQALFSKIYITKEKV